MVLHPRQHGPGHSGFDSGQIGSGTRKRFLDFVNEDDYPRWFFSFQKFGEVVFRGLHSPNIGELLSPSRNSVAARGNWRT